MIIIPARIGSSRFPIKVLADIGGIPMVIRTAMTVADIDTVVIATDSQEVIDIAKYCKPGEIQIFTTNTLDPKDYDIFVANTISRSSGQTLMSTGD